MRSFRYHKTCPEGRIFETDPAHADRQFPLVPPPGSGWVEHRSDLHMTTDQIVEAAVRQELARQSADRPAMERELVKKTRMEGGDPNARASSLVPDKKIVGALDESTFDSRGRRRQ